MDEQLKQLQEKRGQLAAALKAHADKQSTWTAEDRQKWDTLNKDYEDNLKALNERRTHVEKEDAERKGIEERLAAVDTYQNYQAPARNPRLGRDSGSLNDGPTNRSAFTPDDLETTGTYKGDDLTNALHGWLMSGSALTTNITNRHREAAQRIGNALSSPVFVFNLNHDWQNVRSMTQRFRNALSGEDGTAGGYTKDQTLINNLELAMLAYGGMMQVSEIIRTATGEPMRWPTADDTAQTGVQVGENASHAQATDGTNDPLFGSIVWNAYTFTSRIVKVPNELMTDSVFNLAMVLGEMLGTRLGRIQNTKYTAGTGAGTAKGITLCAAAGVTAASATAIAFDELIDLEHSLDPSRRSLPGVGYMFHDGILKAFRKLKDGEGRYLWQAGANTGAPDTLNTYPYTINQDMQATIATGTITALFGQLTQYKIRQVGQIILRRLDERFADTNQTGFLAIMRGDGNLLDAGDHPVKKLTQA